MLQGLIAAFFATNSLPSQAFLSISSEPESIPGWPRRTKRADNVAPSHLRRLSPDYHGRPGEPIFVAAVDDTQVAGVSLVIQAAGGALIEQGPAALEAASGLWVYMPQAAVPEGEVAVSIEVTAVDLPGNRVQKRVDRILRRA